MLRKFPATLFFIVAETAFVFAQQLYVRPVDDSLIRNDCDDISRPCTLRRALYVAADGDELVLQEGNYTAVSGWIADVNDSVTLTGGWDGVDRTPLNIDPENHPSIIDGNNSTAGLRIEPQKDVTIRGVTFARCRSDENGSALYDFNATALHLLNDIFTDNRVDSSDARRYGGAVFISGGTLDINESNFTGNAVRAASNAYGGAIYALETNGMIGHSSFTGNSAWNGNAVSWESWDTAAESVTILESTFRNNGKNVGGTLGGYGTVQGVDINVTVAESLFEDNFVYNKGAGMYFRGQPQLKAVVKNSFFRANRNDSSQSYNDILEIGSYGEVAVFNNVFTGNTVGTDTNASIVVLNDVDRWNDGTAVFDYNTVSANDAANSVRINGVAYVWMQNNILSDSVAAVYVDSRAHVSAYYNNLDRNVTTRFSGSGSIDDEKNSVTGDPRFADDGWHLRAGSAAIDMGECIRLTGEDAEGDRRPFGKGCDIGADEFTGPVPMPGLIMYLLN